MIRRLIFFLLVCVFFQFRAQLFSQHGLDGTLVCGAWEKLFRNRKELHYDISSAANKKFHLRLNRYQDPLPLMHFDWQDFQICYYDYYAFNGYSGYTDDSPVFVRIKNRDHTLYQLGGKCYFHGFLYNVDEYLDKKRDPYTLFFHDISGDGKPELVLCTGTRGAYSYWTVYIFEIKAGTVRNILTYNCGSAGPIDNGNSRNWQKMWNNKTWDLGNNNQQNLAGHFIRDIDNNGVPEIVMLNSGIEQLLGATHGPRALLVIEWNGKQFADKTRKFPLLARKAALGYLDDSKERKVTSVQAAMPYYANMILAGEDKEARTWLLRNGNSEIRNWLGDKEAMNTLRKALRPDLSAKTGPNL